MRPIVGRQARWLWPLLGGAALALLRPPALAQSPAPTAPTASTSAPAAAPAPVAFDLVIDAPEALKALLEQHLQLQRYREITDLSAPELERLMQEAADDARQLLATQGYFDAQVRVVRDNTPAQRPTVRVQVAPGEPVHVVQVLIHFAGAIASDPDAADQRQSLQESWRLAPGGRFTQSEWEAAKQQALRQLTSLRYANGRIAHSVADIDPQTRSARLEITLDSGPAYRLGELQISGLSRYSETLVHRLTRLRPGADFDHAELVAAQQRLADSGFFQSAFITIDPDGAPDAAPVRVTLREAQLQKLVFGLGASTDSGPRLSVEHLHQRLPGIGWRAQTKLSLDRDTQTLDSTLMGPPDPDLWRWLVGVKLAQENAGSFPITSRQLRWGATQTGERIDRSLYLQYDRADTAGDELTVPGVAEALSANYAFTVRHFDALPFPRSGWGLGVELGAGSTLGSSPVPFTRVLARAQAYLPLEAYVSRPSLRASRLAVRGQLGAVLAKDGVSLPSTQLFLAGGDQSVRGYPLRDIGVQLTSGQITAGRYLAVGSVELQSPISVAGRLTDWEGDVFIDAGSVADIAAELHAQVGVGAGARWKSPVGPLQMDLAYGVAVRKFRLHLSVGFAF
jgi:translocation and assembly module TamA